MTYLISLFFLQYDLKFYSIYIFNISLTTDDFTKAH